MNVRTALLVALLVSATAFVIAGATSQPTLVSSVSVANLIPTIGAQQTLTAQASGGVPPYTFNLLVYNPNNVLAFSNTIVANPNQQPDVLVQYSNGVLEGYDASPETNASRGLLLMNVMSNALAKESIYLKSETYAVGSNQILLNGSGGTQTNIKLYGAGEYATKVTGYQNDGFFPGINSIVSDLSIYNMVYESPSGDNWGNDTMRNVFWSGYVDVIYFKSQPDFGNIILYNDTLTSGFDTITILSSEPDLVSPNVTVFDSYLHPVANNSGGQNPAYFVRGLNVQGGTVILVNDIVNVSTPVGPIGFGAPTSSDISTFGGAPAPANILVYGGYLTTDNSVAGTNTIYNPSYPYTTIFTNVSLVYNALESSGPVSNTLGDYGLYTYQKYPMTPSGGPYGVNSTSFLFTQSAPAGTWNAILVVNDSSGNTTTSDLSYTVNSANTSTTTTATSTSTVAPPSSQGGVAGSSGGLVQAGVPVVTKASTTVNTTTILITVPTTTSSATTTVPTTSIPAATAPTTIVPTPPAAASAGGLFSGLWQAIIHFFGSLFR